MSATIKLENTARRDALIDIEKKYQKVWADDKVFEVDAPTIEEEPSIDDAEELRKKYPEVFCHYGLPLHERCFACWSQFHFIES